MPRTLDPRSKAGFVRSLPSALSAAEVISKGKTAGHKLTAAYVYSVRAASNRKARATNGSAGSGKHGGAGRPRKVRPLDAGRDVGNGLVAELEKMISAIVERKLAEMLEAKLAGLAG